jgi:hypothetical protein
MARSFRGLLPLALVLAVGAPPARADDPDKKAPPPGEGKRLTVKPDEVDELVVKADKVTLNNFTLAEKADNLYGVRNKKLTALELSWSIKNRGELACPMCIMVVGLNEKGEPLWALTATVHADPMRTESAQASAYVPAGTLKKTASIRFIIDGDL